MKVYEVYYADHESYHTYKICKDKSAAKNWRRFYKKLNPWENIQIEEREVTYPKESIPELVRVYHSKFSLKLDVIPQVPIPQVDADFPKRGLEEGKITIVFPQRYYTILPVETYKDKYCARYEEKKQYKPEDLKECLAYILKYVDTKDMVTTYPIDIILSSIKSQRAANNIAVDFIPVVIEAIEKLGIKKKE